MPSGRYIVMDGDGNDAGTEDFRCAAGPMGWRYFSDIRTSQPEPHHGIVDLAVDARWRPVRTRIDSGSHDVLLIAEADRLSGWRDKEPVEIPFGPNTHLDYASPAYSAASCMRLEGTSEIEVVLLHAVTCEPTVERRRYELLGDEEVATPVGRFAARRWRCTALATGRSRDLWIAHDVVVAYEGTFALETFS
jgi:hypothetical protein